MLVCLPVCGFVSGNRARPREMADSRVRATARHIHICLRVAVLRDSSHFRGFRPASGPKQSRAWHLWSSSSRSVVPRPRSALGLRPRLSPRYARPSLRSAVTPFHMAMLPRLSLAIRVVMPRRRNTGSLPHSRLSAQSANRIPACHSAQRSVTLPASSPHVKPLQATTTDTN